MSIYRRMYVLGSKIKIRSIEQITTLFNGLVFLFSSQPSVKTTDESLNLIVRNRCSISRYGDGEFNIMNGKSLRFQPYSGELSLRLREIIKSNQENHEVFIPNVFKNVDWCTDRSRNYWIRYLNLNRYKIYKLLQKNKVYYDSLVTRLYIDYKDKSQAEFRFKTFKKLWHQKEVIIIEGEQSRLGIGNNLFDNTKSIKRILCPATDAFAKYDQIFEEVLKHDKSKLVLIALGPTATVLAYDLANYGYHAIDIGHIDIEYEWFLNKAVEKEAIKNKYVGEVPEGTDVHGINDIKYEEEIVTRIS
ncbi:SP_1767 family glycosyltransferase [Gottfriedia acidiceleris]|uniref:SP_1767 family glycosyltransferase n=1 Tax=Gottfriedia acidiceleris TaxID=371036 RepID=A0ABY4JLT3_9BACI|nr:SP_1767 family glycosyltransferase [Gottfriedia acidiceleris]UPM54159.1 SP_1767 family glycosyltransferase [Gottfriedia acidiceleris]